MRGLEDLASAYCWAHTRTPCAVLDPWCVLSDFKQNSKLSEKGASLSLESILDGIGEGFYAVDRDWRIVLFNSEAGRHFRCEPQDVLGQDLWTAFPRARETGLGQLFLKVMESRETVRSETESVIFPGRYLGYRLFPLGDGIGVVFRDITDRRGAEVQRDLVVRELEHRIKNTLMIVQSMAEQTFRGDGIDPTMRRKFAARLTALGNIHSILTQRSWDSADLHELIRSAVKPHDTGAKRFTVDGPLLRIGPKSAVALSMAMHELCTNAVKYGSLSRETGHVEVRWTIQDDQLDLRWRERGGPEVQPPTRKGFGSRMIEGALALQLSGNVTIDYDPAGVACAIIARVDRVREN